MVCHSIDVAVGLDRIIGQLTALIAHGQVFLDIKLADIFDVEAVEAVLADPTQYADQIGVLCPM